MLQRMALCAILNERQHREALTESIRFSDETDVAAAAGTQTVAIAGVTLMAATQIAAAKALQKLDRGVYTECSNCGEEISTKRLTANPAALFCGACQERLEWIRQQHPNSGLTDEQLLSENQ